MISFNTFSARARLISRFSRFAYAMILFREPSSSRIFDFTFCAIYSMTWSSIWYPSSSSFFRRIAIRVSKSGEEISTINPHSNLERSRSSRISISFGGLSEEIIICFLAPCRALKVWKNSSWVDSFPIINCISSISSTSMFRYFSRNLDIVELLPLRMDSISSLVKYSLVTYKTLDCGLFCSTKCAMECIRWVFPRPTPPYIKRGLYTSPGDSATATEAACASLLLLPTTNVSKVYFGFKLAFSILSFTAAEDTGVSAVSGGTSSGKIKAIS